jgi:hypothetical protein
VGAPLRRALEAVTNDGPNAAGSSKAADRTSGAQKYTPTVTPWPSLPQIRGDRFTHFGEQGQVIALTTLAGGH